MFRFAPFVSFVFILQACNGGLFKAPGSETASTPIIVPERPEPVIAPPPPEPLEVQLQKSLEFIQSRYGDGSYLYNDREFTNMETILTEALDYVESEIIDEDGLAIDLQAVDAADRTFEESLDLLSKFTVDYGKTAITPPDLPQNEDAIDPNRRKILETVASLEAKAQAPTTADNALSSYDRSVLDMNVALAKTLAAVAVSKVLDGTAATTKPAAAGSGNKDEFGEQLAGATNFERSTINYLNSPAVP